MGKRSHGKFERRAQDLYETPAKAVEPLLELIAPGSTFIEPCCGGGDLVRCLEANGLACIAQSDLPVDARTHTYVSAADPDFFVTNPPWKRPDLHAIIKNLAAQLPTWLLIDWDWLATQQAKPYLPLLRVIKPIGRVRFIKGTTSDGFDNSCWCLFESPPRAEPALFFGRTDDALPPGSLLAGRVVRAGRDHGSRSRRAA
jgi:hypothetical protein